jgi:hypothetical protein
MFAVPTLPMMTAMLLLMMLANQRLHCSWIAIETHSWIVSSFSFSLYIYIILQHCGLVAQALFFFPTHWIIDWHSRMSSWWRCHNTAQSYYTSDDLHHRCLSRLKNFGRWSRRGDGRHNDYLKYSSLNTTLYVGFGAHREPTHDSSPPSSTAFQIL